MNKFTQIALSFIIATSGALGNMAEKFGGAQLGTAAKLATVAFKKEAGTALDSAVTLVAAVPVETGAKVTITYRDQGAVKTKEVLCGIEEGKIVCGGNADGAVTGLARKWGGVHLGISAEFASHAFKEYEGDALDAAVLSVSVKKNIQGVAGQALIKFEHGGTVKSVQLFCHEHGPGEIDCH